MNVAVTHGWVLWLLPVCLVPLWLRSPATLAYSSLKLLPEDRASAALALGLRLMSSLLLATLLIGLSGPYLPAQEVERLGTGAHIVLLLDRSRSMDQPFAGQAFDNALVTRNYDSKGTIARQLLGQFVAGRRNDEYGMLVFSTRPIQVAPLTDSTAVIQAAITAGNIGRGLSETDVGQGIIHAVKFFEGQPYSGSRIILLISDGGARLDFATQSYIKDLLYRHRVALYWIYLRSRNSPGISGAAVDAAYNETAPARALHEFFQSLDSPYRAFDAEEPDALAAAIEEVNRLQRLPIRYVDVIPRKPVSRTCYAVAVALLLLLLTANLMEIRQWSGNPVGD